MQCNNRLGSVFSDASWSPLCYAACCNNVCCYTSLIKTTRLGIVSGWAGGDKQSVNSLLRDSLAREAPKHRNGALARDFLANYSSWCLARGRVSSLDGHGGVVRIQSTECFSQELV